MNLHVAKKHIKTTISAFTVTVLCILFLNAPAQNYRYRFENLTNEQGLADRIVNAMIQDAQGYIWIGSGEGLSRYDGYNFVVYKHEDNNPFSLSDNEVYALCIDKNGSLWIGTRNGLNRYDAVNERFETFFHESRNSNSPSANEIYALAPDSSGNIWIGTLGGGLDMLQQQHNKQPKTIYRFVHYRHDAKDSNSLSNDQVFSIGVDRKNRAWIGTANGLNVIDPAAKRVIRVYHDKDRQHSIASSVANKVYSEGDNIWLCGKDMLDRINAAGDFRSQTDIRAQHFLDEIKEISKAGSIVINDFIKDKSGNAWIGTNDKGILKVDAKITGGGIAPENFINNSRYPHSLVSSTVFSFLEDRSGVVWIGTAKGVSKYIPSKSAFEENAIFGGTLKENKGFVMSLLADKQNRLWLGTDTDTLVLIKANEPASVNLNYLLVPTNGKSGEQINTLFQSKSGDIYIGTLNSGLYIIPAGLENVSNTRQWKHVSADSHTGLPGNNIYAINEDAENIIWIGTYSGLCRYDAVTGKIEPVHVSPQKKVISDFIIRSIGVDERNNIWCATDNGISVFRNGKLLYQFKHSAADSNSLSNNRVTSIFTGRNKKIWIGSKEGICYYDPAINKFHRVRTENSLITDGIRSIAEDKPGNLWIATNHGLLKYDVTGNNVFRYGTADGLYSNQFISNSVCMNTAGIFYFGTNNGVISFNPEHIVANSFLPPIVITNVKIFDKPLQELGDSILLNTYRNEKKMVLEYNENFFTIEFAALNYINTPANQYAYQLKGIDPQWVNAGTQRFAGYTDIKPGRYTFSVKAANNSGLWNETPASIEVIVLSPWWQKWWFYTLCCLAFCAIVYIIYRVRVRQILKLYRLRSSIAKDLHDDVGSALSSIAMLSRIAQEGKTNAHLKSEEIFSRIGDTSKRMIDLMDDIVWSVNPDNDRFSNMLVRMREYAVEMLEPANIDFSFKIDEKIDELHIPMQMRKDYFLIFKEAVNNLAKYSQCSKAAIMIEKIHRNIVTSIIDNGKGFDPAIINSGNGLKNMKARATTLNGKLDIKTVPSNGTSIILTIPVA